MTGVLVENAGLGCSYQAAAVPLDAPAYDSIGGKRYGRPSFVSVAWPSMHRDAQPEPVALMAFHPPIQAVEADWEAWDAKLFREPERGKQSTP